MGAAKDRMIFGEPFQWHLDTSAHDVTPCCDTGASNLGNRIRICKACQQSYKLPVAVHDWLPVARKLGEARKAVAGAEAEMRLLIKGPEPALCDECDLPRDEHHVFHTANPQLKGTDRCARFT